MTTEKPAEATPRPVTAADTEYDLMLAELAESPLPGARYAYTVAVRRRERILDRLLRVEAAARDLCTFTARYLAGDSDVLREDVYAEIVEVRAALDAARPSGDIDAPMSSPEYTRALVERHNAAARDRPGLDVDAEAALRAALDPTAAGEGR